jgi:signal transduction histidine kinase
LALTFFFQGDPGRIKQILTNLLNNAIKFTHEGEVVLHVRKHRDLGSKVELEISVSDTGIGIAEADLGRLFQPFQQIDATVTRRFGGTGLGLAICKQLAEYVHFISRFAESCSPLQAKWEPR